MDQSGVARSASELQQVLEDCRQGFEVRQVPASEADQWSVIDGALQHTSRGFFSVNGVSSNGESRLLLYQPQAALTGLISTRVDGERWFLLQGRAEPGCLGGAQFGPTVQSTPANFMRLHGGAPTPYVDAFIALDPNASVIDDTTQLDLGERYLFKSKRSILVETKSPTPPHRAFVWATSQAIYEAVQRSAFLNIDLRSILSIARWSSRDAAGELAPRSDAVRRSLGAPIRPDVLGQLMSHLHREERPGLSFVPLDQLANWNQTEMGWAEREPEQGFSVEFFDVKVAYREVLRWAQPLVNSSSEGLVVLACQEQEGILEFYIRPVTELGLATTAALAPSFVRYPGRTGEPPGWLAEPNARVWSETTESDEGGRFYRDASLYRLVRVNVRPGRSQETGFWLRLSELKMLLRTSNVCTIQLRGVISQLLSVV